VDLNGSCYWPYHLTHTGTNTMTKNALGNGTVIGLAMWAIILIGIWLWPRTGQTLVNNSCAPHWEVIAEGKIIDCTGNRASPVRGWTP